jgi:hypothetical protein
VALICSEICVIFHPSIAKQAAADLQKQSRLAGRSCFDFNVGFLFEALAFSCLMRENVLNKDRARYTACMEVRAKVGALSWRALAQITPAF